MGIYIIKEFMNNVYAKLSFVFAVAFKSIWLIALKLWFDIKMKTAKKYYSSQKCENIDYFGKVGNNILPSIGSSRKSLLCVAHK